MESVLFTQHKSKSYCMYSKVSQFHCNETEVSSSGVEEGGVGGGAKSPNSVNFWKNIEVIILL